MNAVIISVLLVAGCCPSLAIKVLHRAIAVVAVVLEKSREIAIHRSAAMECVALGLAEG